MYCPRCEIICGYIFLGVVEATMVNFIQSQRAIVVETFGSADPPSDDHTCIPAASLNISASKAPSPGLVLLHHCPLSPFSPALELFVSTSYKKGSRLAIIPSSITANLFNLHNYLTSRSPPQHHYTFCDTQLAFTFHIHNELSLWQ